jgi:hypothetical protein
VSAIQAPGVLQARSERPRRMPEDEPPEVESRTSGKAVAGLVLGISSILCNVLTAVPAALLSVSALRDIRRNPGRVEGHGLAVAGLATAGAGTLLSCVVLTVFLIPVVLAGMLVPAVQRVRDAAGRVQSQNNLRQLALAMHQYSTEHGHFPAAAICDANGRPLLSWRVALLPYLGPTEQVLYQQFKLNEPWDSPHNKRLLAQMPMVYQCATIASPPDETVYQVFVGNGAPFETKRGPHMPGDFPDGLVNTILIVEASQSVPWTKPEDLPYRPNRPLPPLGNQFSKGFNAVAADGAVHFVPKDTPEPTVRGLITRNDGQVVSFP